MTDSLPSLGHLWISGDLKPGLNQCSSPYAMLPLLIEAQIWKKPSRSPYGFSDSTLYWHVQIKPMFEAAPVCQDQSKEVNSLANPLSPARGTDVEEEKQQWSQCHHRDCGSQKVLNSKQTVVITPLAEGISCALIVTDRQ